MTAGSRDSTGRRSRELPLAATVPVQRQDAGQAWCGRELARLAVSWSALMRAGRFAAAWQISDAALQARTRLQRRGGIGELQFVWDGTPLAGKRVLIRCNRGLGDAIQFARLARGARALAREVIVLAQPALVPLLQSVRGVDRVLPLDSGREAHVPYEVEIGITELPYALRLALASLPGPIPYLHVEPAPRPPGASLAVGLVWRSGDWDAKRSIPPALLAPLESIPGIEWQLFQRGPALEEWPHGFGRIPPIRGMVDEARQMRALDLLISVDTCSAHLAGALGVPVWTLLHSDPDWRWMLGRQDSPWYPTMRLFRQAHAGEWQPVIAAVGAALQLRRAARPW